MKKAKDILQIYFDQIKAYPLLAPEEEIELARFIEQGDQDALHKLIMSNLRLVSLRYAAQDHVRRIHVCCREWTII